MFSAEPLFAEGKPEAACAAEESLEEVTEARATEVELEVPGAVGTVPGAVLLSGRLPETSAFLPIRAEFIVALALVGALLKAFELWDRKRSIERQVREGDRRFRELNPGNTGPWYLLTGGFQYSWDEQAKKVRRQEISEDNRKRIEQMHKTGKAVSRRWIDQDGNTRIDYGDADSPGTAASAEEGKG